MTQICKTAEGGQAIETRYRANLKYWPVPNRQFTAPMREGETFVVACGPEDAPPLLLFRGSASNSFMWMVPP